jgi:hypothetical protein
MSQVITRAEAFRAAWARARSSERNLWEDAAGRLHEALDSGLDQGDLNRFTKRCGLLADAIRKREPLLAGPGLTLYAATKVMSEVLEARDEQERQGEIMQVLFCSDSLDDDEDDLAS